MTPPQDVQNAPSHDYHSELDSDRSSVTIGGIEPHPRLPQYARDEVQQAIEVVRLLIKVRDRCRKHGLINW
jgi:hypothetical protein